MEENIKDYDSLGLESADKVLTEEEIKELKDEFRQQLHYYRDQEPWKVWTRDTCYQSVWKDLEENKELDMTELRILMDLDLREKDYIDKGFTNVTRKMVLDEINKFEQYLPAIQQHVILAWPNRYAPSYDSAWQNQYSLQQQEEINSREVQEKITFENHVYVLNQVYPEVPTFEKYSQRYYRWYGNEYLRNSIAKAGEEKNGWKHVVKDMAKIDMVDTWKLRELFPEELKDIKDRIIYMLANRYAFQHAEKIRKGEQDDGVVSALTIDMTVSKASSRSESVKKLRNELLEQQQKVLIEQQKFFAEQQERRDKQRDEREEALEKRMRDENKSMIDDMGSKILKALLPIMEDKKVTNNRLSREKAAKRQSFVQSSVFGQMEVDMNEDEPEVPVKGSYVYNAAKPEPSKRSPPISESSLKPKARPEEDKQTKPPVTPNNKGKSGAKILLSLLIIQK